MAAAADPPGYDDEIGKQEHMAKSMLKALMTTPDPGVVAEDATLNAILKDIEALSIHTQVDATMAISTPSYDELPPEEKKKWDQRRAERHQWLRSELALLKERMRTHSATADQTSAQQSVVASLFSVQGPQGLASMSTLLCGVHQAAARAATEGHIRTVSIRGTELPIVQHPPGLSVRSRRDEERALHEVFDVETARHLNYTEAENQPCALNADCHTRLIPGVAPGAVFAAFPGTGLCVVCSRVSTLVPLMVQVVQGTPPRAPGAPGAYTNLCTPGEYTESSCLTFGGMHIVKHTPNMYRVVKRVVYGRTHTVLEQLYPTLNGSQETGSGALAQPSFR